jgi:hypothetical protein
MPTLKGDDGVPSGFNPNKPFGVWGDSGTQTLGGGGNGVVGSSRFYTGVAGFTLSSDINAAGVYGGGHIGVAGGVTGSNTLPQSTTKVGVYGTGSGENVGGIGVQGVSDTSIGVLGESQNIGVLSSSDKGVGVQGTSPRIGLCSLGSNLGDGIGVVGISNATGVFGWGGDFGGYFIGNVHITGLLTKGGGGFKMIIHLILQTSTSLIHLSSHHT